MVALGLLFLFGILMIASASIPYADGRAEFATLKFFWSQLGYMVFALVVGFVAYQIPTQYYYRLDVLMGVWVFVLCLILATILFGKEIYGAKRWLSIFGFSFQPVEFAKMMIVPIVAEYMTRRAPELRGRKLGAIYLGLWYIPLIVLLMLQNDFGSTVVISATIFVMLFVGGARLVQYALLFCVGAILALVAIIAGPTYRMGRILSFMNPFDDPYGAGHQLSHGLIAFGRGEVFGVGYGNSIQKLHIPEPHTDFLLSVAGEEFGFLGVLALLILEFTIVAAMMRMSYKALKRRQGMFSHTIFGFAVVLFGHIVINAGGNMGILPIKGLAMPFFSYGGTALLFSVLMIAFSLKIDREGENAAATHTLRR